MATRRERLTTQLTEALERTTGNTVVPRERLELLEASDIERRQVQRDLDLLAYTALDYVGGAPQEIKIVERRRLTQQARVAWMKDPQAGAAVDLMNDFVFGRGIPRPKAADEKVQEIIDEAWDDPDNQLILTSYAAQLALGTDLTLQSNLFFLVFDDGEDGKVKLGILDHDSVQTVVRDKDNRLRILYYVAHETETEWDYDTDQPKQAIRPAVDQARVRYYEHWSNVDEIKEEGSTDNLAPDDRVAEGKVFHVAVNRTTEMAFGHPTFDRILRWYNAYNKFMDARVDIMEASAAFVMKRKVKGTPSQLQKMATQNLSRRSSLGASMEYPEAVTGPKPASIITESENVTHEDFNINTNAPAAAQDAQMLRAQISAATRFPQSYYGDAANSSLATATSLELPVLKAVENRQEVIESVIRFFIDRVIERAVEAGRIPKDLDEAERAKLEDANKSENAPDAPGADATATTASAAPGAATPQAGASGSLQLTEAHEDAVKDEEDTARDLGYEFSMPSPLKRLMTDLITGVMNVARTFDPNNTNMELSRVLLTVALGEGLELEDPAAAVEKIFPPGYVDPAIAAAAAAPPPQDPNAAPQDPNFGEFAPTTPGADGQNHPDPANPYGAPMTAQTPEQTGLRAAALRESREKNGAAARAKVLARRGTRVGLDDVVQDITNGREKS